MRQFSKVTIVLKDDLRHDEYNKRIIDYLNDRHTAINNNMFTIAIDVADDSNINDYVKDGMESIPAMRVSADQPYIYGVNSIMAALSKLEIVQSQPSKQKFASSRDEDTSSFYKMALEEMQKDDQEDPDAPSTLKAYHQELPEAPLTERMIEEKAKAYERIYEQRRNRNKGTENMKQPRKTKDRPSQGLDVDQFIANGKFDKGEEMLMRQITENLQ